MYIYLISTDTPLVFVSMCLLVYETNENRKRYQAHTTNLKYTTFKPGGYTVTTLHPGIFHQSKNSP